MGSSGGRFSAPCLRAREDRPRGPCSPARIAPKSHGGERPVRKKGGLNCLSALGELAASRGRGEPIPGPRDRAAALGAWFRAHRKSIARLQESLRARLKLLTERYRLDLQLGEPRSR
jgi:hypothetical protein